VCYAVSVCVFAYESAYMCVYVHTCVRVCVCVCMRAVYVCVCVCVVVFVPSPSDLKPNPCKIFQPVRPAQ